MAGRSGYMSQYERQREERIKERKAFLNELFPQNQLIELKRELASKPKAPSKRHSLTIERPRRGRQSLIEGPIRRSVRLRLKKEDKSYTEEENDTPPLRKFKAVKRRHSEPVAVELDSENRPDFDPEDLKRVAKVTSEKIYDSYEGTTCHQCRQKTRDLKTRCRNVNCVGVRGQFCGPCLRNRYGEEATEAINDETWVCPPCRQVCNCSFCLPKRGRRCTGIMIHLARDAGYSNVHSFLQQRSQ